jgi:lipopolysaccharide biosynthesis protein
MSNVKPIAIYLPQFHPIPENDLWWGKGFTEWTNVTKAKPLFKGHYQPRLPADLGFYDLRLPEVREQQALLAKENGIYGFCYYHYWFHGKRILERPFQEVLNSGKPDFPFMLFWANESWSRRWIGGERDLLIKQTHSKQDDINHINWLCENAFGDKRYIKIYDRPVFIFYRPQALPNYRETIAVFKETAIKNGFPEPFLIASNSHTSNLEEFDHILNFEPQLNVLPDGLNDSKLIRRRIRNIKFGVNSASLKVYDYSQVKKWMDSRRVPYKYFPCVFVGWDNSARRGEKGIVMLNQNKQDFKRSLETAKKIVEEYPKEEQLLFINAWNEWAEGNHLEPCTKFGKQFLEAVREVFIDK